MQQLQLKSKFAQCIHSVPVNYNILHLRMSLFVTSTIYNIPRQWFLQKFKLISVAFWHGQTSLQSTCLDVYRDWCSNPLSRQVEDMAVTSQALATVTTKAEQTMQTNGHVYTKKFKNYITSQNYYTLLLH